MDGVDEPVLEDPREVVDDEPRAVRAQRLVVELQGDLRPLLRGPALRRVRAEEHEQREQEEEETPGTCHGRSAARAVCLRAKNRDYSPPSPLLSFYYAGCCGIDPSRSFVRKRMIGAGQCVVAADATSQACP